MFRVKRRAYRDDAVENATKSVKMKKYSITQAAKEYGVPRQTLADKMKDRHPKKYGRNTILSTEDEKTLLNYITYMASIGHPLNISEIKLFAWSIAKRSSNPNSFGEAGPSRSWWIGFKRRHTDLTLRKPDKLDRRRSKMSNKAVVDKHFEILKDILEEHDLVDKPSHIFNVDESGMDMDTVAGKVVVNRNTKHTYQEASGDREHITVNVCASASGYVLPPMIVFEQCFPSGDYSKSGPTDCLYAKSPNGYMDGDLFLKWFTKIFLPSTAHLRPALLILDGHTSHLTIELIDMARENNVILFCLPPHTTHFLQPLDVAVFRSLKSFFSKIVRSVKLLTLGTDKVLYVNRRNFTAIFREAFEISMVIMVIKNGFRKCGICPLSPRAIDWSKVTCNVTIPPTVPSNSQLPQSIRGSPLLDTGMIPERLQQCLIIPHFQETRKESVRVVTTSRVITSDEHRKLVKEKVDAKHKAEEEKEKRKQLREQKRKERERSLARKQKTTKERTVRQSARISEHPRKDFAKVVNTSTSSSSSSDSDQDTENQCVTCHREIPPDDISDDEEEEIMIDWLSCEKCDQWYHEVCGHTC